MKILICSLILASPLLAERDPPGPRPRKDFPEHLHDRSSRENRLAAIRRLNGLHATEQAVTDALRYLKNTQNKDGSWTSEAKISMTAIALLCFFGHGESAQSEEFGIPVLNGLTFLVDAAVKQRGYLTDDIKGHRWPYEHALAVYALAEGYSLCEKGYGEKIPHLKRAVEIGGQILINKQHRGGGWDYHYDQKSRRGGDVSNTGLQLKALKACKYTGLDFANLKKSYRKGIDYLERMQGPSGALGYTSPNHLHGDGTTLTAVGASCFQDWEGPGHGGARKAVKFIDRELKFAWNTPDCDLYGQFYAAQALKNHGEKPWNRYHQKVFPEVLENQAPDGSFLAPNHGDSATVTGFGTFWAKEDEFGNHYRTCLATLILQTYYR